MLSLFQDLLIRVLVIVIVMDALIVLIPQPHVYWVFLLEIVVLFISIWYDLKVRKWKK
jgi:hypothetical protein